MIWMQSLNGKALEIVNPVETDVDFEEIAWTLAGINRYGGAAEKPVSVAQHTLIAMDCAEEHVRPWVLLHDAHEARTGDITTPVARALEIIANEVAEPLRQNDITAGLIVRDALRSFKQRHDEVIYRAAGLPPPHARPELATAIKLADEMALMTERRDFLKRCLKPWEIDAKGIAPARKAYRLLGRADAALELLKQFHRYLPVFAARKV